MPIVLVGTLDTKGPELGFIRDLLHAAGLKTTVIDAGVLGPPYFTPDISSEQVFAAAGTSLEEVRLENDRGKAIAAAAEGVTQIVRHLFGQQPGVDGILAIGGSAGTTIGTAAMRALPFGLPKLMVTTLASGQVKPFVGVRDILMMHSVVDISGLNRMSRMVLSNAAAAMIGMVKGQGARGSGQESAEDRPLITATMF